ncbi:hypothetical protein JOD27_008838 [Lentzea nigeriaca]|nr:hypothetical protein [Lentzea nigeriaca]
MAIQSGVADAGTSGDLVERNLVARLGHRLTGGGKQECGVRDAPALGWRLLSGDIPAWDTAHVSDALTVAEPELTRQYADRASRF